MKSRKRVAPASQTWRVLLLLAAGVAVYANALQGPFMFDDLGTIVQNPTIRKVSTAFAPPANTAVAGRPVVNVLFALNHEAGGLDVFGYHAVNVVLHLGCGLLLFGLVRRAIAGIPADVPGAAARLRPFAADIATAIALLWIVHPLNSEVVDYVTQRTESAMAAALLLTMYASVRALEGKNRTRWTSIAIAASAIGMACKETMAVAPVLVVLYDRAFGFTSFANQMRRRWPLYTGLAATWIVVGVLVVKHGQTFGAGFTTAQTSSWTYFLNQPGMILRYLRLAIWPDALVLYYGWPRALTVSDVWPSLVAVSTLVAFALVAVAKWPRAGFIGAWCVLLLAPTSSLIPIATEVGAERRIYVPLAGLLALGLTSIVAVWPRLKPQMLLLASAAVAAVLAVATMARNQEYRSALTMAETIVARWPTPNAEYLLGTELAAANRPADAIPHIRAAAAGYPPARFDLGRALLATGQIEDGVVALESFIRDEPRLMATRSARLMLARAYGTRNQPAQATGQLQAILAVDPADADAHGLLADMLASQQAFSEAVPHYQAFVATRPNDGTGWTGLGISLIASGRSAEASEAFRRAVAAEPNNGAFHVNLARALVASGDIAGASSQAGEAIRLDPAKPAGYEVLGRVRIAEHKLDDARRAFEQALARDPSYTPAIEGLRALR